MPDAARRGVRDQWRPLRRGRHERRHRALAGKGTQMFDAKGMTIVPGFIDCHNHAGGTTLLYEVLVGNPFEVEFVTIASIIEKLARQGARDAAGHWVEGYFHDDTKLKDKRPLNAQRPRPGVDRASGRRPASRRPHVVLQQQGVRAGGHHEGHAESAGRHVRPRRERRLERPRDRSARGVFNGVGQRPTFTRGAAARSASATALRTSRSSSPATA